MDSLARLLAGAPGSLVGNLALFALVERIIGIVGATWLATRLRVARLPSGMEWQHLVAVSATAGLGFTVSLFVAGLAFTDEAVLHASKIGVVASIIAGTLGAVLLFCANRETRPVPAGVRDSEEEA